MATKPKTPSGNRLTEIVAYRRSQGSSVTGALAGGIKERLKEKFDPRQLINQKGLLTALFPGLKTYQSKTMADKLSEASKQIVSFDEIKPTLETISYNTRMTAKNTMVLPALHRDVNVIRQNMVKLVKMRGGDARTKADMYFVNAKDREEKYEREMKKERRKSDLLKLKEEKKDEKDKSLLVSIFGSILSGLKNLFQSILGLGKTLLSAFSFLTNGIANVVKGLFSLILGDKLFEYLKNFLGSKGIFRRLFETILSASLGSILRAIFSSRFLGLLAGVLVTTWFAEGPWKRFRNEKPTDLMREELPLTQDVEKNLPLPSEKITDAKEIERSKFLGLLPEDFKPGTLVGSREGRPEKVQDEQEILEKYNRKYFEEYRKGDRQPYKLRAPSILSSDTFLLLTQKEAEQWGKKFRNYLFTIKKIADIQKKQNKTDADQNTLKSLTEEYYQLKDSMLSDFYSMVDDQLMPSPEKAGLLGRVRYRLESDGENATLLNSVIREIVDTAKSTDTYKAGEKFIEDQYSEIENTLSQTSQNITTTTKDKIKELKDKLNFDFSSFANRIENKTSENKMITSDYWKTPMVINQSNVNERSDPNLRSGKPASAWNEDFMNNYFNSNNNFLGRN